MTNWQTAPAAAIATLYAIIITPVGATLQVIDESVNPPVIRQTIGYATLQEALADLRDNHPPTQPATTSPVTLPYAYGLAVAWTGNTNLPWSEQ